MKLNSCLLPMVAKAANDPAPDVREANMGVLVALAGKSGNKALLEKVCSFHPGDKACNRSFCTEKFRNGQEREIDRFVGRLIGSLTP